MKSGQSDPAAGAKAAALVTPAIQTHREKQEAAQAKPGEAAGKSPEVTRARQRHLTRQKEASRTPLKPAPSREPASAEPPVEEEAIDAKNVLPELQFKRGEKNPELPSAKEAFKPAEGDAASAVDTLEFSNIKKSKPRK